MTRNSKFPAKITLSFCTLFCLWPCFAFSQDVDTAWVRRYNGPGNGGDKATAIAVDSSGNIYVAGSSFDSTTGYDFCTIKYLPNGDTEWVRRFNGLANKDDYVSALELDDRGNAYITGRSNGNFATLKYDPAGNQLWVKTLPDILVSANQGAYDLALDKDGNVYVTGVIWDGEASTCWGTVKYDSLGNELWFRNFYTGRIAVAIAVDTGGNAYVTGYGYGPNLADYLTVKYYPNGDTVWARRYNGLGNTNDYARAIAIDISENIYVVGESGYDNFAVIKYGSSGDSLWVRRSNSVPEWFSYGASLIETDRYGNVYVGGNYWFFPDLIDWTTAKYDSVGNQIWFRHYNGIDMGAPREPKAIVLDDTGNVYVTGYDASSGTILKYNALGNLIWEKKYDGGGQWAELSAIAVDQKGNVYAAGSIQADFLTNKYSPLPQLRGDLNSDGTVSAADVVLSINCAFFGEPPPVAPIACDLNCDGKVTPADAVVLMFIVFLSAPAPC